MAGTAVTAASDGGANVVGGTSCDAEGCVRYEGVVPRIRGGGIPKMRWLAERVRAATSEGLRAGRDVVLH
jgi:hypothetical protein